jgi:hypothetical protein
MRIIGLLFTIGVLSGAMAIRAQVEQPALQGLPQYGVTLTGTLENAVLENHSGRVVIGCGMRLADANGRSAVTRQLMAQTFLLPAGIPDGSSFALGKQLEAKPPGQGPIVTAALRSVIFGDGQFVGVDEMRVFEQSGKELKVITEVGIMAKRQAWDQVEALAQAYGEARAQRRQAPPEILATPRQLEDNMLTTSRQAAATMLVQTRKSKGEAAADQLAQSYSSLPLLWKYEGLTLLGSGGRDCIPSKGSRSTESKSQNCDRPARMVL